MATKKSSNEAEKAQSQWDPERVRRFRMVYDAEVRGGKNPKSTLPADGFQFEGLDFLMGFAHYLLEYLETCVFWPPQSRIYTVTPDLPPKGDE